MTRSPRTRPGRRALRAAAVPAAAAAAVLLLTGTASAHVRVFSEGAQEGSPATLRFRVPSEKADAATVRVDVTLPAGVTSAGAPASSEWTAGEVPAVPGGAAHVVWTATAGHELQPDQHRSFEVRVGPLPKSPSLAFDVAQTYSDGTVVHWNQRPKGDEKPDFPAPVLVLDAAAAAENERLRDDRTPPPMTSRAATPPPPTTHGAQQAGAAPWLPWTAAGAALLGAAGVAVVRRRTAAAPRAGRS